MALVILTEANPLEAVRAVFVRCGMVLIPLSWIFIRYFPHIGRTYNVHSGEMQSTGVTFQKNSLGTMILVCGLICLWDWLERTRPETRRSGRIERWTLPIVIAIGLYLLRLSDSKTSLVCFMLGAAIIAAVRLPLLQRRINRLGIFLLVAGVGLFVIDWVFGISAAVLANLGRDLTFTGRTDVWRELLNVGTDPFLGTGFMSFWDDEHYQSLLPNWVAFSAHNGYLEVYLAGGYIGVSLLALMLLHTGFRVTKALAAGTSYAVVRFAVFCVVLLANFSESNFACMTPLGLLFLIASIGEAHSAADVAVSASEPPATSARWRSPLHPTAASGTVVHQTT
jgi:O-antigen ligase